MNNEQCDCEFVNLEQEWNEMGNSQSINCSRMAGKGMVSYEQYDESILKYFAINIQAANIDFNEKT